MSCFWDIFDRFLIVLGVVYFYHSLKNIIFDDTLARRVRDFDARCSKKLFEILQW